MIKMEQPSEPAGALCYPVFFCMRRTTLTLSLVLAAPLLFTACATIAPPQPPSLELPKPPGDLRARRKGDHVILTWTIPSTTTDRQRIRSVGPTRICRGPETILTQCIPVGEAVAQPPSATKSPGEKIAASYTDTLPQQLQTDNPSGFITYAV